MTLYNSPVVLVEFLLVIWRVSHRTSRSFHGAAKGEREEIFPPSLMTMENVSMFGSCFLSFLHLPAPVFFLSLSLARIHSSARMLTYTHIQVHRHK